MSDEQGGAISALPNMAGAQRSAPAVEQAEAQPQTKNALPQITDAVQFLEDFFGLAPELRNKIFGELLPEDKDWRFLRSTGASLQPPAMLVTIDAVDKPIAEFELFQSEAFHYWVSTRKLTNSPIVDGPWMEASHLLGFVEWLRWMDVHAASIHDMALDVGHLGKFKEGITKLWELAKVVYEMPEILQPGKLQLIRPYSIAPAAFVTWSRRVFEVVELGRETALAGLGLDGLDVAFDEWVQKEDLLRRRPMRKTSTPQTAEKSRRKNGVTNTGIASRLRVRHKPN